jgi:hypothetical protein
MKKIIISILSFFMIFNCNSLSYANNFNNNVGFTTNIINLSFDNTGIHYENNLNVNEIKNPALEYSLQFGIGLLSGMLSGFIGLFVGALTGMFTSFITGNGILPSGIPVFAYLSAVIFFVLFSTIGSALGINVRLNHLFEKKGNIWLAILVGLSSFLLIGSALILFNSQILQNDLTRMSIATISLLCLVNISQIATLNLTLKENKTTLEEDF